MKKLLILLAFISLAIVGCNKNEAVKVVEDNTLIMTKSNSDLSTSNLYMKGQDGQETKLSNNLMYNEGSYYEDVYYLNGENKCLYVDEDRNLQMVSEDGEKEKIGSDVASTDYILDQDNYYGNMESSLETLTPSGFGASKDGSTIIYVNYEGNLYMKKSGEAEKEKISSEVTAFQIDITGEHIYYIKNGYDLYVYTNGESEKISSDASQFKISDNGKFIAWTNSESELYIRNLDSEDKEKLSSDTSDLYSSIICDDGSVVYLSDGELYIYTNGDKQKVASDVIDFCKNDKKICYLNNDQDLYEISTDKTGEKNKIHSDVMDIEIFDSTLYFTDEDMNLFKMQDGKDAEKVGNDLISVSYYNVVDGNLVYMKSDNSIYLNDKKIVSNSKGFTYNSVCFGYVDQKNQVHVYNFKDKKDSVQIKNAKKYSYIYLGNKILYSNELEPKDLEGYWKFTDEEVNRVGAEFKGNKIIIYGTKDYKQELKYTVNNATENTMDITFDDDYEGYSETIEADEDKNNITIIEQSGNCYLERITKDEFDQLMEDNSEMIDSQYEEDYLPIESTYESSVLTDSSGKDYSAENVTDGDYSTTWAEGVDGSGECEWIKLDLGDEYTVTSVDIVNGLVNDNDGYYNNNRVAKVKLEFSDGTSQNAVLDDDEQGAQSIDLYDGVKTSYVKIIVESVYPGDKYDDTCISSVELIGY